MPVNLPTPAFRTVRLAPTVVATVVISAILTLDVTLVLVLTDGLVANVLLVVSIAMVTVLGTLIVPDATVPTAGLEQTVKLVATLDVSLLIPREPIPIVMVVLARTCGRVRIAVLVTLIMSTVVLMVKSILLVLPTARPVFVMLDGLVHNVTNVLPTVTIMVTQVPMLL